MYFDETVTAINIEEVKENLVILTTLMRLKLVTLSR